MGKQQHFYTAGCYCGNQEIVEVVPFIYFCPRQWCRVGWFCTNEFSTCKSTRIYMTEEETDALLLGKITKQQLIEKERTRK